MKCPALLTHLIYRAAWPAARIASPLLPERIHPGKRAQRAIAALQAAEIDGQFPCAVLASCLRSLLLQRHVSRLDHIEYDGALTPAEVLSETRPIIFATPHYGVPTVGAVAVAQLLRGLKILNVFYDKERHGAYLASFFKHGGIQTSALLGGLAGVRAALRTLERGECLAILPDAFDDIEQTLVVPFFGRLLRVASGTAFLALRTRALLVPAFAVPSGEFGLRITFGAAIDPTRVITHDERQAVFTLTHLLFSRIEEQLRLAPEHWNNWEVLPNVSTSLGTPARLDGRELIEALKAKFRALPPAVQDIPELELLLE